MISEGSCDTVMLKIHKLINYILKYIQIENYNNISQYECIFDQINAAIIDLFETKEQKIVPTPNFWTVLYV